MRKRLEKYFEVFKGVLPCLLLNIKFLLFHFQVKICPNSRDVACNMWQSFLSCETQQKRNISRKEEEKLNEMTLVCQEHGRRRSRKRVHSTKQGMFLNMKSSNSRFIDFRSCYSLLKVPI